MPFAQLATAAIARSLGQVADRESDLAEVFLEQLAETEVPSDGEAPGIRERSESGFAIRLVRDGLSWLAVRDGFEAGCFVAALREVARALPSAPYPEPSLEVEPLPPADLEELLSFPAAVVRAIRSRHVAFPIRLTVRRHHRAIQVVGTRLVPEAQEELYFSCEVELPWGRHGGLYPGLGRAVAGRLADRLVGLFAARDARPPRQGRHKVLFRPAAAAVLLHEAVAHALEADTLILGGRPEAASGLRLGSELVSVLDDPTTAPEPVRRDTDDEGMPAVRRWLLQEGVVRQPLADLYAARNSEGLTPGQRRTS